MEQNSNIRITMILMTFKSYLIQSINWCITILELINKNRSWKNKYMPFRNFQFVWDKRSGLTISGKQFIKHHTKEFRLSQTQLRIQKRNHVFGWRQRANVHVKEKVKLVCKLPVRYGPTWIERHSTRELEKYTVAWP